MAGPRGILLRTSGGGLSIVRLILCEVMRVAIRRDAWDARIQFVKDCAEDMRPQIFRRSVPGWKERDDKWAFPRSVLDAIAEKADATVQVFVTHDNHGQYRRRFSYMLRTYGGIDPTTFTQWAGRSSTASTTIRSRPICSSILRSTDA